MSIQTNFRAQDMLGVAKPAVKKAPSRNTAPAAKPEPVVIESVGSVKDETETVLAEPIEEISTEE